jgi:drug/metabolite transporter (DMT)-like permease
MIGIIFALCNAVVHALSAVLIRKRIDESDSVSVALVTSIIGNAILWPLALLFVDLSTVNFYGVLFFAMAGSLAPGISRLLLFHSMETIGVSISRTIFSIYPIYSVTLGFLLFGEILNFENIIGVFFVLVGVVLIERSFTKSGNGKRKIISKKDLLIPIIASLAVAFSHIIRKQGLNIYNEQLLGVAIGYSAALLFYLIINSYLTKTILSVSKKDFKLFWIAGAFLALAWILAFYALSFEKVSIVTPLMQTQPLFILFFAYLYLRKREPLSLRLIATSILVVLGVILVIM